MAPKLKYIALVFLIPGMLLLSTALPLGATLDSSSSSTVRSQASTESIHLAQRVSPLDLWQRVYELLPDLPREDQYISSETGQQATRNTLMSRLVRYHTLIKGRSPNYRFDWKLTLADYLGANELIRSAGYPGHDSLTTNPLSGDVEAISRLTRAQRDALVDALVSIFSAPSSPSSPTTNPTPSPTSRPTTPSRPSPAVTPIQPQPGDAQLLRL